MELNSRKLEFVIWIVGNHHFPKKMDRNKACIGGRRIHISRVKHKCLHNLSFWCNSNLFVSIDQYMEFLELLGGKE